MLEEIKKIKSGKKELRQFGLTIAVASGLLGGLLLFRERSGYFYFFAASVGFLLLGLAAPILLKPIQKAWMSVAVLIGWVMTRVILIILFYLVITPLGLLAKLFGKRFLDIGFKNNDQDSYWVTRPVRDSEQKSLENQF